MTPVHACIAVIRTTPIHSNTTRTLRMVPSILKKEESSSMASCVVQVANTPSGNVNLDRTGQHGGLNSACLRIGLPPPSHVETDFLPYS